MYRMMKCFENRFAAQFIYSLHDARRPGLVMLVCWRPVRLRSAAADCQMMFGMWQFTQLYVSPMLLHSELRLAVLLTVRVNQDDYSHRADLRFSLLKIEVMMMVYQE